MVDLVNMIAVKKESSPITLRASIIK